jgi:hydroxyethylthiazole kinase-like uncharacterized protein yjeF
MNKLIVSVEEARLMDEETCRKKNLSTLDLIKQAGEKLALCFREEMHPEKEQVITVVAGTGNNGCDSLVMGLSLWRIGFPVNFVLIGQERDIRTEAWSIIGSIRTSNARIFIIDSENKLGILRELLKRSSFLVDGLFGTGLNRNIEGLHYQVILLLNASGLPIFSIDIPSGLNGNSGKPANIAVKASLTGIVQCHKLGNLFGDALDYGGKRRVVEIDLLDDKISKNKWLLTKEDLVPLPQRRHNSHKYHYGSVLVIGGSSGMLGAPLMSAYAALRTGSGLATMALPKNIPLLYHNYPEIITAYYQNAEDFAKILEKKNVLAFGPGLGKGKEVYYGLLKHLFSTKLPLLVDADGLFYLKKFLNDGYKLPQVIITPHSGELAFLMEKAPKDMSEALDMVQSLCRIHQLTVVLKGPCTLIANEDVVYFSCHGNPGMATAGSGDVLTGIIASLIGQGLSLIEAAKLGVYLHSQAGNLAAGEYGERSLVATDICKYLPEAIKIYSEE